MKIYKLIGHIFFAIIAIIAVYFYAERTIFIDSAFQIFKILNFETWNIEAGRFSSVIIQILPLVLIKLNLPLNYVLLSYSLSFVLIYYLVYCLVIYKLKNEVAGITIVFLLCLCIRQSFYHIATETHQGLVYSALLYAWLCYSLHSTGKWMRYGVAMCCILLCYFSHPITLLPVLFILGYHAIDKGLLKTKGIYFLSFFSIAIFVWKAAITPVGSYEGDQFVQLGNFMEQVPHILSFSSTIFFAGNVNNLYYLALLLLMIVLITYLRKGERQKFGLVMASVFLFMLITLITYHRGESIVMMEKNFMPLTIFIIIPLANDVLSNIQVRHNLKVIMVSISLAIGLIGIVITGGMFSKRLDYLNSIIVQGQSQNHNKTFIKKEDVNMDVLMVTWAVGVETLLLSSLDNPQEAATSYIVEDIDELGSYMNDPNIFLLTPFWRDWNSGDLNQKYFKLDKSLYQSISP